MINTNTSQLDKSVVNLMAGIKKIESGGDYAAEGKSGEYGAYQYTPSSWKTWAGQYLGNPNADISDPSNQNKVAYYRILDLKNQGLKPSEVVSMWNSGKRDPTGNVGVNKYGVAFDTPSYVKNVLAAAIQYASSSSRPTLSQSDNTGDVSNPSFGQFAQNALSSTGNLIGNTVSALAHPIDTATNIGKTLIGAGEKLGDAITGNETQDSNTQAFDSVVNFFGKRYGGSSVQEVAHNIANTAYKDPAGFLLDLSTVLTGAGGIVGKVGEVSDVSALSKAGELATNIGERVNPLGIAAKAVTKPISAFSDWLPEAIAKKAFPTLKETANRGYALENVSLGSVKNNLAESEVRLGEMENQIQEAIKKATPDTPIERLSTVGDDISMNVMDKFPNSGWDTEVVWDKLKKQFPTQEKLIERVRTGDATLGELNDLRRFVDKNTYKATRFDTSEVRAGKDVAEAFGNALRDEVQSIVQESQPVFAKYSKEIALNKALKYLSRTNGGSSIINLYDLMAATVGHMTGVGAFGGYMLEKLFNSPSGKIGTAKVLSSTLPKVGSAASKVANVVQKSAIPAELIRSSRVTQ